MTRLHARLLRPISSPRSLIAPTTVRRPTPLTASLATMRTTSLAAAASLATLLISLLALTLSPQTVHATEAVPAADVAPTEDAASTEPLVIEDITCTGNDATNCDFIRRHVYLSPGEKLDEDEVKSAKIRLGLLPNFSSSDITLKKGSERGRVVLEINVVERTAIATEFSTGTSLRNEYSASDKRLNGLTQRIAGKVAHQNLFGRGKALELSFDSRLPLDKESLQHKAARLQYTDPQLFGSKKYFASTGVTYQSRELWDYSATHKEYIAGDVALGRRFGDFSYFRLGYAQNFWSKHAETRPYRVFYSGLDSYKHGVYFDYGWNSEDDPYFPTQGSRFNLAIGWLFTPFDRDWYDVTGMANLAYRTSWRGAEGAVWSFNLGGSPSQLNQPNFEDDVGISVGYAKPITPSKISPDITRARWYAEAGSRTLGYSTSSGLIAEPGIKAGVRMESKTLGIIDLYAMASSSLETGRH